MQNRSISRNVSYTNLQTGAVEMRPGSSLSTVSSAVVHGDFKNPGAWSYVIDNRSHQTGTRIWWSVNPRDRRVGPQFAGSPPLGAECSGPDRFKNPNLANNALENLNEKSRGSLDLSVGLAELGSTKRMLGGIFKLEKYAKAYKALSQRPGRKGIKDVSGEAANLHLEWTYGVKPLLSDIYAAADESVRYVRNALEKFEAGSINPLNGVAKVARVAPNGLLQEYRHVWEGRELVKIKVWLKTYDDDLSRWTSLNPLSIAWELTPYSFVADWALDIGSYLRNLETALLYNNRFHSGSITYLEAWDATITPTSFRWGEYDYVGITAERTYRSLNRVVLTGYPLPRLPTFDVNMGTSRMLSAAALLRTFLK
jgi:hypothetical protein